ncbi:E3 ubiquitin-protein ligase TRIM33 [Strongylocentrotus purpuratus]|uniref:B box-type domain-containing protein n=1 Tax=Strongylocentrotus purpuratus TaxID=7668 RepID=A0A7M7HDL6_STRPU|nr:E3 ubiquitin-protein ligase TRIM33 [Strongylocentrotus purpuratus]
MALSKNNPYSLGDDLTCGICEGKLRNGQFLKCFHSFCDQCLRQEKKREPERPKSASFPGIGNSAISVAQGVFRVATNFFALDPDGEEIRGLKLPACPICKRNGKAETHDSRQYFFPNIFAEMKIGSVDFTDKLRGKAESSDTLICESCQENNCKVTSFCSDCKQFICATCVVAHKKLSVTRNHSIVSTNDIKNGKNLVDVDNAHTYSTCSSHPSSLSTKLCTICQVAICTDCVSSEEHRMHPSIDVKDGIKPFLDEASTLVSRFTPSRFDKIVVAHLEHKKAIADKAEELRKQIIEDADIARAELLQQLEDKKMSMLAKVSRVESDSTKATNELIKSLEELRIKATTAENYVDVLKRRGTVSNILMARRGGFVDLLKDLTADIANKESSKTQGTLRLHTTSFPFPRYQLKWYSLQYSE